MPYLSNIPSDVVNVFKKSIHSEISAPDRVPTLVHVVTTKLGL